MFWPAATGNRTRVMHGKAITRYPYVTEASVPSQVTTLGFEETTNFDMFRKLGNRGRTCTRACRFSFDAFLVAILAGKFKHDKGPILQKQYVTNRGGLERRGRNSWRLLLLHEGWVHLVCGNSNGKASLISGHFHGLCHLKRTSSNFSVGLRSIHVVSFGFFLAEPRWIACNISD